MALDVKKIIMNRNDAAILFEREIKARAVIEEWRRDYNEQRPKKDLDRLPPAVHAAKLALRANPEMTGSVTV